MFVRETTSADWPAVLQVHTLAFGRDEESLLVAALLADPSARPLLSLLAEAHGSIVGHVLFTKVELLGPGRPPSACILAPLAVVPAAQNSGVGRQLIEAGCDLLAQRGVRLIFVLGDPRYYGRRGFTAALPLGLQPPHEVEPAAAWMVRALAGQALGNVQAKVRCAAALEPERYWRE